MSLADKIFVDMCKDILENGTSTEGEKVRPHWEDGTSAYTIKKFGVVNRYDLSKEFPAITLRKTAIRTCTEEMLWIWQRKSNNIHDLNSTVWDEWADADGSIGKAYGYQLGVKHQYKEGMMDQVDRVIYDLRNNPFSRRIMTNIYVHADLHEMNLYPCAYSMTVHVIADAHIYDRHVPIIRELIEREQHPAPKFTLNPDVKDFYQFTTKDITIEDYVTGPQIKNIPIAV